MISACMYWNVLDLWVLSCIQDLEKGWGRLEPTWGQSAECTIGSLCIYGDCVYVPVLCWFIFPSLFRCVLSSSACFVWLLLFSFCFVSFPLPILNLEFHSLNTWWMEVNKNCSEIPTKNKSITNRSKFSVSLCLLDYTLRKGTGASFFCYSIISELVSNTSNNRHYWRRNNGGNKLDRSFVRKLWQMIDCNSGSKNADSLSLSLLYYASLISICIPSDASRRYAVLRFVFSQPHLHSLF